MSAALLEVRDLSLGFATEAGIARVLDGVNLSIGTGQVMGLVGESGCGKTTLARAILGVLPPATTRVEAGTITFRGRDILSTDASDLRGRLITFVPQDPFGSFNPLFTIETQIMDILKFKSPRRTGRGWLPALLETYPRARRRIDRAKVLEMLDAVQLPQPERVLAKYPHELSGGQRQRLMIAMALLPEPELLIADEPTTALDVTIQAQILGLLRRLATDRGVAVLLTTHDLGTAYEICDAVTVMYAGQEVEAAPVERFFAAPTHPYTARLLASLPRPGAAPSGIPGEVPNLVRAPGGCRFNPRCQRVVDACTIIRPAAAAVAPGHLVRCHNPESAPA
ncbi:MAG: ABC transporter ATP-binding protein [Thalassobaculales bacterium]